MKTPILTLLLLFPLYSESADLKIVGAIYYGSNTITPCAGFASELIGSSSDISKLNKYKKIKQNDSAIFIVFTGYEQNNPTTAAYSTSYQMVELISYENLTTGLEKCQKLMK